MGLENLQSIFNDLSENTNSLIEGRHGDYLIHPEDHSSFDDIDIDGPQYGDIKTKGEARQLFFSLPKTSLGTENTSDYNDILKHSTIDPTRGIYSPVIDNIFEGSFEQYDIKPSEEFRIKYQELTDQIIFLKNRSIQFIDRISFLGDTSGYKIDHTFGFTLYNDLIKIPPDEDPQIIGPTSVTVLNDENNNIVFKSFIDGSVIGPQLGYSQNEEVTKNNPTAASVTDKIKRRDGYLFQTLGENNQLGVGKFVFGSLYEHDHSGFTNRSDIEIRLHNAGNWWESSPNGVAGTVKLTRTGIGSSANLNIKEYSNGFRTGASFLGFGDGREPYIVNEIPDDAGVIQIGNDRDLVPFTQTLQDMSRLTKYYSSTEGRLWFIGKDFLYGAAFASTPLPGWLGQYSGGYVSPKEIIGDELRIVIPSKSTIIPISDVTIGGQAINSSRLLSHIMVPPVPSPNTGLLSLRGLTLDAKKPGISSLRKPLVFSYGEAIKQTKGTPLTVSKIEQLQGVKSKVELFFPFTTPYNSFSNPFLEKEYTKRIVYNSDDDTSVIDKRSHLHRVAAILVQEDREGMLNDDAKADLLLPITTGHSYPGYGKIHYPSVILPPPTDIITSASIALNITSKESSKDIGNLSWPVTDVWREYTDSGGEPKNTRKIPKILPFMKLTGGKGFTYTNKPDSQRIDHVAESIQGANSNELNSGPPALQSFYQEKEIDADPNFYVRFKDLRNNKFIYFRGYVTGINENLSPSWTTQTHIGRSEPVYLYQGAERDLSFNLKLHPNNKNELRSMYDKLEYLIALCYPSYNNDYFTYKLGETVEKKEPEEGHWPLSRNRMQGPFTELYMGHIGYGPGSDQGQFGYVKSLSYTVDETGDWDADDKLPRLIDVAISYQILHKRPPQRDTEFYQVAHHLFKQGDFDTEYIKVT